MIQFLQKLLYKGPIVQKVGTLHEMQVYQRDDLTGSAPAIVAGTGTTNIWIKIYFQEHPGVVQGWCHVNRILNRVKEGERIRLWVDEATNQAIKVRPEDRKLKWWQY